MDKKALRAEISAQKRKMTPDQIEATGRALGQMLREHPAYAAADAIFGYLSYNQEVPTPPILAQARADGKRVAVPKIVGDEMRFFWLDDINDVEEGYCGIPEPKEGAEEAFHESALVLMPGLAFDREGHRCGYGGGFYDRWLSANPGHPTLALCYGFQMLEHLDTDAHDIPVDFVLSCPVRGE